MSLRGRAARRSSGTSSARVRPTHRQHCATLSVALAALVLAGDADANDRITVHRDARGVLHFSNLTGGSDRPAVEHARTPPQPSLSVLMQAPPTVEQGDTLQVTVTIPGSVGLRGHLDLVFDENVLAFRDASDAVEGRAPGQLTLRVDPGIGSVYSVVLELDAIGAPGAVANIRATAASLENSEGDAVGASVPPALATRVLAPAGAG
ncbi:MAG: hypothetical protein KIS79_06755 [Burkholderiales bacterium]|nr:hypothetical protein [Burkholderiales bacterium]